MAPLIGRFYNDRANGRASLACKDLLLLANGRAQAKRKCPVVQTLDRPFDVIFPITCTTQSAMMVVTFLVRSKMAGKYWISLGQCKVSNTCRTLLHGLVSQKILWGQQWLHAH